MLAIAGHPLSFFNGAGAPPANEAPTAEFSHSVGGLTAAFFDLATDPDGTITGRLWNFGDGNTSTATNPTHTYAAPGSYTVTYTVTDDDGASDPVSHVVVIPTPGATRDARRRRRIGWRR